MSDQDFNFAPPPQKRDRPKPFEPPPWERDRFDEIERRKSAERAAQEKAAQEQADAVLAAAAKPQGQEVTAREAAAAGAAQDGDATAPAAAGTDEPIAAEDTARATEPSIASASVDAMLVQLKGEEPPVGRGIWRVSLAVSFAVIVIGVAIGIIGIVALSKKLGATGDVGGLVLLSFGLGFIGVGLWVMYQTLRQRGVL